MSPVFDGIGWECSTVVRPLLHHTAVAKKQAPRGFASDFLAHHSGRLLLSQSHSQHLYALCCSCLGNQESFCLLHRRTVLIIVFHHHHPQDSSLSGHRTDVFGTRFCPLSQAKCHKVTSDGSCPDDDKQLRKLTPMVLRGSVPPSSMPLKDFSGSAGLYFVRIRTPSAIISGSSLGAFWTFSKTNQFTTRSERILLQTYHALVMSSFVLSLTNVVISTGASITVLHGHDVYNHMAESAYMLLRREFDYEFTLTRWAFSMSLLLWIVAITNRVILEFHLARKERRNHVMALVCAMTALASHLLSYINQHLFDWANMVDMTIYVIQVCSKMYVDSCFDRAKVTQSSSWLE